MDLLEIIRERVRVEHFFRPFRGNFKGRAYDSDMPPPVVINSSSTCAKFSQFVSDTIIQWVTAGVIAVWGPVDHVAMSPNHVLKSALENGGCRSSDVNGVLKDIFCSSREYNFSLDVC